MRRWRTPISLWALLLLVGCAGETPPRDATPAAATSTPAPPSSTKDAPVETMAPEEQQRRGKAVFVQCRACHSLNEGGPHLAGPNLHGMFGAPAAARDDYIYSDALTNASIVWSAETLDAWLRAPRTFLPGSNMFFTGVPQASDRAALIAYLEAETR